jgi:hypothetical protein
MKEKRVRYDGGTSLRANQNYSTLTVGGIYKVHEGGGNTKYRLQNDGGDFYEYPIDLFSDFGDIAVVVNRIKEIQSPTVGDKKLALLLKIDEAKEQIKLLEAEVKELEKSPYLLERWRNEGFPFNNVSEFAADLNDALGLAGDNFQIRLGGAYTNKGLYLSDEYDWELVTDDHDKQVLLIKAKP